MPVSLNSNPKINLGRIVAPMVNQSDLPFRLLVRKYGATMAYTQMYVPDKLLNDQEYLEYHIRDLTAAGQDEFNGPVVAQLSGNDPELVVRAGRKIQSYCDAIGESLFLNFFKSSSHRRIDINLGCPQEAARDGHFGAYLLGQKDWDLVEDIGMCNHNLFRHTSYILWTLSFCHVAFFHRSSFRKNETLSTCFKDSWPSGAPRSSRSLLDRLARSYRLRS